LISFSFGPASPFRGHLLIVCFVFVSVTKLFAC